MAPGIFGAGACGSAAVKSIKGFTAAGDAGYTELPKY